MDKFDQLSVILEETKSNYKISENEIFELKNLNAQIDSQIINSLFSKNDLSEKLVNNNWSIRLRLDAL